MHLRIQFLDLLKAYIPSLRLLLGNGASLEAFVALKTSNLVFRPKNLKVVKGLKSIQSGDRNFCVQGLTLDLDLAEQNVFIS